jgi:hypothetical protein
MRLLQYLNEKYVTDIYNYHKETLYDDYAPVFVNPDKKEISKCKGNIRYIVDFKKKNLYIWHAYANIHTSVMDKLYKENIIDVSNMYDDDAKDRFSYGEADVVGGKLEFIDSDVSAIRVSGDDRSVVYCKWTKENDSWLNIYFTKPYIKTVMEYTKKRYNLSEEYFKNIRYNKTEYAEIFKNPTRSEIYKLIRQAYEQKLRFFYLIDKKEMYVWDSNYLHYKISPHIDYAGNNFLKGGLLLKNNKLKIQWISIGRQEDNVNIKDYPDILQYINEEYTTSTFRCTIFVNPTRKELIESLDGDDSVRYLIDVKKQKLYIWKYTVTHGEASIALEDENLIPQDSYPDGKGFLWGVAFKKGSKLSVDLDYDPISKKYVDYHGIDKANGKWLLTWFNNDLYEEIRNYVK